MLADVRRRGIPGDRPRGCVPARRRPVGAARRPSPTQRLRPLRAQVLGARQARFRRWPARLRVRVAAAQPETGDRDLPRQPADQRDPPEQPCPAARRPAQRRHGLHRRPPPARGWPARAARARPSRPLLHDAVPRRLHQLVRLRGQAHDRHPAGALRDRAPRLARARAARREVDPLAHPGGVDARAHPRRRPRRPARRERDPARLHPHPPRAARGSAQPGDLPCRAPRFSPILCRRGSRSSTPWARPCGRTRRRGATAP